MYEFIFREVARNSSRVQEHCNEWRCCQTVNVKQHKTVIRSIWMAKTCSKQAATLGEMCSYVLIYIFFCFKPIKSPDLAFLRLFTYMVQQPVTRGTLQYVRVTGQRPARLAEVKGNDIFWSEGTETELLFDFRPYFPRIFGINSRTWHRGPVSLPSTIGPLYCWRLFWLATYPGTL